MKEETSNKSLTHKDRDGAEVHHAILVKPLSTGNCSSFRCTICPSEKGGAHRWKETGINWPNSLSNQSLCFCDGLMEGADESGGWAPLIGSGQTRENGRQSGNGSRSLCTSSHRVLSLYHCQYWHLCPHYLQLSAMYRPFICYSKNPVFLHYTSVYTTHFPLLPLTPHTQWLMQELPSVV